MKFLKSLTSVSVAAMIATSCIFQQVEPTIMEIAPSELKLSADNQQTVLSVNCDFEWNAYLTQGSWFSITCNHPAEPETIGAITVESKFNFNESSRSDTLVVTSGSRIVKVPITQEGTGSILPQKSVRITDTQGATFVIDTKNKWTIAIEAGQDGTIPSWFEVSPTSGEAGTNTITVTPKQENYNVGDRNASLLISVGGSALDFTVIQSQTDVIFLNSNSADVSAGQSIVEIELQTNIDYTYSIDLSCSQWISYIGTKSLNKYTLSFQIAENEEPEQRVGTILFTSNGISESFIITQAAAEKNFSKVTDFGVYNMEGNEWQSVNNVTQTSIVDYGDHYSFRMLNPTEKSVIEFSNLKKAYFASEPVDLKVNIYRNDKTFTSVYSTKVYKISDSVIWFRTDDNVWFIIKRMEE